MTAAAKTWFSNLSFRWKAILFIATIEGAFNIMFAFIVVGVMQNNLEEQFFKRAQITSQLFATSTANAVLATDIASLESFVEEVMQNKDLYYARVRDSSSVLAERARSPEYLEREFVPDTNLSKVGDDVFDTFAKIRIDDEDYGQVEIGLSTGLLGSTITQIQIKVILIGAGEILFSAFVSFLLGTFLVRRLVDLQEGSHRVAEGDYDFRINDEGHDELGSTARSFNEMSGRVGKLIRELRVTNADLIKAKEHAEAEHANAEKARDVALAANKAKSEFLASMSHEIRTPITGVMGFADLLLDDDLADESRNKVYQVKNSMGLLQDLLNEILDLSKLEAGKMEIETEDIHLPTLVEDTVNLFQIRADDNNLKLSVELSDDLPEGVHSDSTRIRQILVNLIGNAIKFTEQGSIRVKAGFENGEGVEPRLHFDVIDTGIGMNPETMSTAFSEFTQADASISRQYQGSGLGLSICKRLVGLMGGEIGVESQVGKGSGFWFTLPYAKAKLPVSRWRSGKQQLDYKALRNLNILVVDDISINRQAIRGAMEKFDHVVSSAKDGAKAVEAHKNGDFDLILMDLRMPNVSGLEATRMIRQLPGDKSQVPIIAVTADVMKETRQECLDAGMNEMQAKPIDRSQLLLKINTVMGEEIHIPLDNSPRLVEKTAPPMLDVVPVLDLACLADIFDDPDMYPELLADYIRSTEPLIDKVDAFLSGGDPAVTLEAAHAAKGASRMAGAMRMGDICESIQTALSEDKPDVARQHIKELRPAFENVRQAIEKL